MTKSWLQAHSCRGAFAKPILELGGGELSSSCGAWPIRTSIIGKPYLRYCWVITWAPFILKGWEWNTHTRFHFSFDKFPPPRLSLRNLLNCVYLPAQVVMGGNCCAPLRGVRLFVQISPWSSFSNGSFYLHKWARVHVCILSDVINRGEIVRIITTIILMIISRRHYCASWKSSPPPEYTQTHTSNLTCGGSPAMINQTYINMFFLPSSEREKRKLISISSHYCISSRRTTTSNSRFFRFFGGNSEEGNTAHLCLWADVIMQH